MKIKDLPWFNRPGYKLMKNGVRSLDDAELLAILFGRGSIKESALELANRLINKYNLNKLEDLGFNELVNEIKLGRPETDLQAKITAMKVISLIELSKRYNKLVNGVYNIKVINSAKDVYNMFIDEYRNYKKEVFIAVLLDTKNKVICTKEISVGTLNTSLVHPREIFKEAIKESANSIILVHNHPSGDPTPSGEDLEMTKKIIEIGKILGIPILDHVIIGDKYWSWREEN